MIDVNEVEFSAIRAQGPGGQNVNKVSNAVHVRFDIAASSLPDHIKERLLALRDSRITKDGVVVLKAQQSRSHCPSSMPPPAGSSARKELPAADACHPPRQASMTASASVETVKANPIACTSSSFSSASACRYGAAGMTNTPVTPAITPVAAPASGPAQASARGATCQRQPVNPSTP